MRTQPSSIMSSASALAAIPEQVSEVVSTVQKALQPYAKVRAADGVCSAEQRRDVRVDERVHRALHQHKVRAARAREALPLLLFGRQGIGLQVVFVGWSRAPRIDIGGDAACARDERERIAEKKRPYLGVCVPSVRLLASRGSWLFCGLAHSVEAIRCVSAARGLWRTRRFLCCCH